MYAFWHFLSPFRSIFPSSPLHCIDAGEPMWCVWNAWQEPQKRQEPLKNTQKSFSFQVIQSSRLLNWNKIKDCRFLPILLAGSTTLRVTGSSRFFSIHFFSSHCCCCCCSCWSCCLVLLRCFLQRVHLSSVMFILHLKHNLFSIYIHSPLYSPCFFALFSFTFFSSFSEHVFYLYSFRI